MRDGVSMKEGVYIYIAKMPSFLPDEMACPPKRKSEIDAAAREHRKKELYYGWKLLEFGAMDAFGISPAEGDGGHKEDGNVSFGGLCCSLSHSGSLIVAALSERNVGIDVERFARGDAVRKAARRILTEEEKAGAPSGTEEFENWLIRRWTEKESLYKRDGGSYFDPACIDTLSQRDRLWGMTLVLEDGSYHISAALGRPETAPAVTIAESSGHSFKPLNPEKEKIPLFPKNGSCYNI